MIVDLESGQPLAQALSQHPKVFDNLYVSVVHVGENSGRLDEAFIQLVPDQKWRNLNK